VQPVLQCKSDIRVLNIAITEARKFSVLSSLKCYGNYETANIVKLILWVVNVVLKFVNIYTLNVHLNQVIEMVPGPSHG
jgi:hypothetical protein